MGFTHFDVRIVIAQFQSPIMQITHKRVDILFAYFGQLPPQE